MEFTWPSPYVFECYCGQAYRRGDVVSKACCLEAMEGTPGLQWAENTTPDWAVARNAEKKAKNAAL